MTFSAAAEGLQEEVGDQVRGQGSSRHSSDKGKITESIRLID
jgi:hypothetical protein